MDRVSGGVKSTKAGEVRDLLIESNLRPLLWELCAAAKGKGRVIARHPHPSELASCLREDLKEAGCERADLFANDRMRIHLRYHDLRGTAASWMAMRGDSETDIMERLGHWSFSTSLGYIRRGRQLARAFGDVFPPVPECLLRTPATANRSALSQARETMATPTGSAQYETTRSLLRSAASEVVAERLAMIRLVA
jgi:hypothetical protein